MNEDTSREVYLSERRSHAEAYERAETAVDTWLLTLSGGALGLSMTFIKDLAKPPVWGSGWLILSWMFLGIAVVAVMLCQRLVPGSRERFIEILDKHFSMKERSPTIWADIRKEQGDCKRLMCIDGLNITAFFAFVVGLVALVVFVLGNLPK